MNPDQYQGGVYTPAARQPVYVPPPSYSAPSIVAKEINERSESIQVVEKNSKTAVGLGIAIVIIASFTLLFVFVNSFKIKKNKSGNTSKAGTPVDPL